MMIRISSPLYFGLILSANKYDSLKGKDLTPLCHVSMYEVAPLLYGFYQGPKGKRACN